MLIYIILYINPKINALFFINFKTKEKTAHTTTIKIKTDNKIMLEPIIFIPNEELSLDSKLAYVLKININKIPTLARIPTTSKMNFT
ncbi:hypothetical protein P3U62_11855 [Mammaliicoccus vitulinus]|nr:hypothetical protein [Mammaliicoccus vitulinus]WQK87725.1 hypothetical protein P3U62_11855 [Mammaliicoccus vitulinus]